MKNLFMFSIFILMPLLAFGANDEVIQQTATGTTDNSWGYIAAALAVGLSSIAAGIAVGLIGSSALGAISEKPEISGKALIFLGLAEGIAIYGLIVSIMILGKLG